MNYLLPFIAVLLGALTAIPIRKPSPSYMKLLLAFSGAFLLSNVVHEFLPAIYGNGNHHIGIFLVAGIFIQILLEFFSKGAEHGHLHLNSKIKKFPYALFISLCIHSFLEGIPLQENDGIVYAIAVHKIPIAFIFINFLLNSNITRWKAILIILIFAIMTPLGSALAENIEFLKDYMLPLKAIVAGIVLHVSTTLILEASEAHKFNLVKLIIMLLGGALAFVI